FGGHSMKNRICAGVVVVIVILAVTTRISQAQQAEKPQLAEEAFKNVKILKGIPVDEFMDTMGMFSAATNMNCVDCHAHDNPAGWEKFAKDTPLKETARRMLLMVKTINKDNFKGVGAVTCYTCHHGDRGPKKIPSLIVQYSPPVEDPDEVNVFADTKGPTV